MFLDKCATTVDIGVYIKDAKDENEVDAILNRLTRAQKTELLINHVRPQTNGKADNKSRRFLVSWLDTYKWSVYSFALEGVMCIYCALFDLQKANRGRFVVKPFKGNWRKFKEKASDHQTHKYHQAATAEASDFLVRHARPTSTVTSQLSANVAKNVARIREILKCIIEALGVCGKQCLAIRGDKESAKD